jgi:chromate reductase
MDDANVLGTDMSDAPAREPVRFLVFSASLRAGSLNSRLARLAAEVIEAEGGEVDLAAMREFDCPSYDGDVQDRDGFPAGATELRRRLELCDGFVISSPEYNASLPGVLKNAIDWVSRMKDQPFAGKPVALQSAATGLLGGARMQYHLRQSLTSVDAVLFGRPEVIVTLSAKKFDEKTLELTDQPTKDMVKLQLETYAKFLRRWLGKN